MCQTKILSKIKKIKKIKSQLGGHGDIDLLIFVQCFNYFLNDNYKKTN